jgi:hypothetical protein
MAATVTTDLYRSLNPGDWRGESFRHDSWRGRSYPPWSEEFRSKLNGWLENPTGGVPLKPGVVWRFDNCVVKRFPARTGLSRLWRNPEALAVADRFRKILPVPSPRPWLALAHPDGRGILISDFIEGRIFKELWEHGGPPMEAFPAFMALMHKHGVFHGDPNCRNMIWTGDHWVLLDLGGLRTGLHLLRPRYQMRRQWGQLYAFRRNSPIIQDLFLRYYELMYPGVPVEKGWQEILSYLETLPEDWQSRRKTAPGKAKGPKPSSPV